MVIASGSRFGLLPALLISYGIASLLHFSHNAEFLADYPNLPAWLSRGWVYLVWAGTTAVGVVGWLLLRGRHRVAGLVLLAIYAELGFDGLLHYRQAPFASHTRMMNATILLEACTAALLLVAVVAVAARRPEHAK